ncbi:MAG: MFS transporter, partial [Hyphomicrobiales bacterium]|nr:MFS transporter [Hyphomicrobiales bacterium]
MLVAAGFLLAGNGLQATLVALRAGQEGFPATLIGLMGTTYYLGYIAATFLAPGLIRGVGHIRVFAALASVAACGTLLLSLVVEPVPWVMIRCVMGFCFCGLFMVIESWLNDTADNTNRARILSIYRLVDFGAVTGIQFLLPVFGTTGFEIFAVTTLLFCVSLVPVSLSERCNPIPPAAFRFDIGLIWRISPLACMGCLTIGLTTSAFRLVGPFYATEIGLDVTGVAIFMSAGLLGGAIFQYPMGWL